MQEPLKAFPRGIEALCIEVKSEFRHRFSDCQSLGGALRDCFVDEFGKEPRDFSAEERPLLRRGINQIASHQISVQLDESTILREVAESP